MGKAMGSDKYVLVVLADMSRVTRATTRARAHALATRLGPRYAVWNLWTRRFSSFPLNHEEAPHLRQQAGARTTTKESP